MKRKENPKAEQSSRVAELILRNGQWHYRPRLSRGYSEVSTGRRDRDAVIRAALAAGFGSVVYEGKTIAKQGRSQ
jgi:hypothetical protein